MSKIGLIGAGKMGAAIIKGHIRAGHKAEDILVKRRDSDYFRKLKEELGFTEIEEYADFSECDFVILAVKPKDLADLLKELREVIDKDAVLVSLAAGVSLSELSENLYYDSKVIRAMPNTAVEIGQGVVALCPNEYVTNEDLSTVKEFFSSMALTIDANEKVIHAVTGLSGSGPAFAYIFVEALADGAVFEGLDRNRAYKLAAKMLAGAANMVLETGDHPGKLKDDVCSPNGTTIAGVKKLEDLGFRASVMEAVIEASEKAKGN